MGEVIQFPGFDERTWREIEPTIRKVLLDARGPADMADWVCDDMKNRFLAANAQTTLTLETNDHSRQHVTDAVTACVRFMHDATNRMLLQMLRLEIELYGAKHR